MTKTQITFQTVKGATIELTAAYGVNAKVVGRNDMAFSGVSLVEVAGHGLCVSMGPVKAEIRAEDVQTVMDFFAAEDAAAKKRADDYLNSEEYKQDMFHARMNARMHGRNSDH